MGKYGRNYTAALAKWRRAYGTHFKPAKIEVPALKPDLTFDLLKGRTPAEVAEKYAYQYQRSS